MEAEDSENSEQVTGEYIGMSAYPPATRMVALVGWAHYGSDENVHSGCTKYDVVGIVLAATKTQIEQHVQIVVDGELITLSYAEQMVFDEVCPCMLVTCPWPRHEDRVKLRGRRNWLIDEAIKRLETSGDDAAGDQQD